MVTAIVLCGGSSSRLKPQTTAPKALLDLGGITLLDYQIKWLRRNSIEDIVIATNEFVSTTLPVRYAIEREKLGTGGAVKNALPYVNGDLVYVMNVDDIVIYNVRDLVNTTRTSGRNYIVLSNMRLGYGLPRLGKSRVLGFEEKPKLKDMPVSVGHYCFQRDDLEWILPDKGQLEDHLPILVEQRKLYYKIIDDWVTINTFKEYTTFKDQFIGWIKKSGVNL